MQEFYDMDFQTAVQELLGQTITALSHSPPKDIQRKKRKNSDFRIERQYAQSVCLSH